MDPADLREAQKDYRAECAKFRAAFAAEHPTDTPNARDRAVSVLLRLAAEHQSAWVAQCSGPDDAAVRAANRMSPQACTAVYTQHEAHTMARIEASEKALRAWAKRHGVALRLGGDPRGFTVKVMMPRTGAYNTWGGESEGFGVPTLNAF